MVRTAGRHKEDIKTWIHLTVNFRYKKKKIFKLKRHSAQTQGSDHCPNSISTVLETSVEMGLPVPRPLGTSKQVKDHLGGGGALTYELFGSLEHTVHFPSERGEEKVYNNSNALFLRNGSSATRISKFCIHAFTVSESVVWFVPYYWGLAWRGGGAEISLFGVCATFVNST